VLFQEVILRKIRRLSCLEKLQINHWCFFRASQCLVRYHLHQLTLSILPTSAPSLLPIERWQLPSEPPDLSILPELQVSLGILL